MTSEEKCLEEFDKEFPSPDGRDFIGMERISLIHSFILRTRAEVREEERERGNKEIAGAIEMSKHGWIEQGRMEERERILNHPLMEEEDESPSNANPFWSERKAENSLRRELKKVITKE